MPVKIYPNPTDGSLNIDYIYEGEGATVELRDALGRVLVTKQLQSGPNSLLIRDLSNGVYLLNIRNVTGNTIHRSNLVKQ